MSHAVTTNHLAAIAAQLELAMAQVEALRHHLASTQESSRELPKVVFDVPDRCKGFSPERCGLQDEDARIPMATMGNPHAWQCVGCRARCLDTGDKD